MEEPQSHQFVTRLVRSIQDSLSARGINQQIAGVILFFFFVFLTLIVHESGHIFTARMYGCSAGLQQVMGFTGASGIDCPDGTPNSIWVKIALAGPIISFLFGLWLWFVEGKDSIMRMGGLIAFLYSTIPNLSWWLPNSDMNLAIHQFGLSLITGAIICIAITGFSANLILQELTDKKWYLGEENE